MAQTALTEFARSDDTMPFLTKDERAFLEAVSGLAYANPFLPERVDYERQALGADFEPGQPVWSLQVEDPERRRANAWKIAERAEVLADQLRERLEAGAGARPTDLVLYEDAVLYCLFHRHTDGFHAAAAATGDDGRGKSLGGFYSDFRRDWRRYLEIPNVRLPTGHDLGHTFACFSQIQRAFYHIFSNIIGGSMPAARLRATVWQSIFTHDMRRYRRTLYNRMGEFATLITGPSGTGKELVARAIAASRYLPFDEAKMRFREDPAESFHAVNLAALSPTLIESELFGHRRGAFTGAVQDRKGWLEICPPFGTVFLDEIGELEPSLQVKLLRVIETRTFQPVGDTTSRCFHGKLIAATNRDLSEAMRQGQFREDLYYRLCSDQIMTPSFREQLDESSQVLGELLLFMARRAVGEEAELLAREVEAWVVQELGSDYPWPGNYRELEQCVRNVLIRRKYRPPEAKHEQDTDQRLLQAMQRGELTADQLLGRYAAMVHRTTGSYQETARRLKLDRRTVKSKIESARAEGEQTTH